MTIFGFSWIFAGGVFVEFDAKVGVVRNFDRSILDLEIVFDDLIGPFTVIGGR